MTVFLVHAGHAVVAKIGRGSVGPAVGDTHALIVKSFSRKFVISRLLLISTVASTVASSLVAIVIASVVVVLVVVVVIVVVVVVHVGLAGECIDKILEFGKDFG